MIKVIIAIHSFKVGGMERVASELANYFVKKKDIEVHIILYGIKRDIFYGLHSNIIIHKPNFGFDNSNRTLSTIKTLIFLRKKIKNIQPDTILSFGEYWNNMVLIANIGLKYPVYIADRSEPLKDMGKLQNNLRRFLYPMATGLILQTQQAKFIYEKLFKNLNIKVIGNPIRKIENNRVIDRENIILMVGRLIETKHQDRLIEIFSKIQNPEWKLVLVGGDDLRQNFSERIKLKIDNLKFNDSIKLVGNQSDVESYYLKSKIFAFTSSSEGFPNVIGEAMSAGLPVVAYDCVTGPSEMIIDSENGYLIPLFDDELFKNKLMKLMNDESLRLKLGIKAKKIIQKFNKNLISQQFLDFILSNSK